MYAYTDKEGVAHLLNKIRDIMEHYGVESQTVLVELLDKILSEDKIQRIIKLKGTDSIPPSSIKTIRVPCGFDAYEIKTIEARNTSSAREFQLEILEDDVSNKVIFKSLLDREIYSNAGDVCNIDEQNRKVVYLRIRNPNQQQIDISYEIKLLNLLVAKIE